MRRLYATALLLTAMPGLSQAQSSGATGGVPQPSIGLPLPSIGLPHPPMGLPPAEPPGAARPQPAAGDGNRDDKGRGRNRQSPRPVFLYPLFYVPPVTAPAATGTAVGAPPAAPAGSGRLVVDVAPLSSTQIYVDGYYVGTPADYPEGLELSAGAHAFEVRVPGAEPASTSVQIAAGRTITYRATIGESKTGESKADAAAIPATPPAATPPAAASRAPFYVIPGCYLGNVPPDRDNVPEGCDLEQVRVIAP